MYYSVNFITVSCDLKANFSKIHIQLRHIQVSSIFVPKMESPRLFYLPDVQILVVNKHIF